MESQVPLAEEEPREMEAVVPLIVAVHRIKITISMLLGSSRVRSLATLLSATIIT